MKRPTSWPEKNHEVPETPLLNILIHDKWFYERQVVSLRKFYRIYCKENKKILERKLALFMEKYDEIRNANDWWFKMRFFATMDTIFGKDRFAFLDPLFGEIIPTITKFNKSWMDIPLSTPKQDIVEETAKQLTLNFPKPPPENNWWKIYTEL